MNEYGVVGGVEYRCTRNLNVFWSCVLDAWLQQRTRRSEWPSKVTFSITRRWATPPTCTHCRVCVEIYIQPAC